MDAMGQISMLDRCKNLSHEDAYGLLCMVLGALSESVAWPTLYMVLSEFLPIFEAESKKSLPKPVTHSPFIPGGGRL